MRSCTKNTPDIACWRITSDCNRKCSFCYGPEVADLETEEVLKIVNILADNGVRGLGLTGGEPLFRPDIDLILKHIRKKEIEICLSTNADNFLNHQKAVLENVSIIGLPLEGSTPEIHNALRGKGSFESVINTLKILTQYPQIQIHIGTVLVGNNYLDLPRIEELIGQFGQNIIYWKIYELVSYQNRKKQTLNKAVAYQDIKEHIEKLGNHIGRGKIFFRPANERTRCYFLINPNGDVILPVMKDKKTSDLILGNFLKEGFLPVVKRWQKEVSGEKYHCHRCGIRFAKFPQLETYQVYPMDPIFRRIVSLALKYYSSTQHYTKGHIAWMIPKALMIAKEENIDPRLLLPLVILHDIGYSKLTSASPFESQRRLDHMRLGAVLAQKVLDQAGYPKNLSLRIVDYVAKHDLWSFGQHRIYLEDKVLGTLNDLDFTSMLADASFPYMKTFLQKEDKGLLDFLAHNEKLSNRPFVTKKAEKLFEHSLSSLSLAQGFN